jgi:hypothetical protein
MTCSYLTIILCVLVSVAGFSCVYIIIYKPRKIQSALYVISVLNNVCESDCNCPTI